MKFILLGVSLSLLAAWVSWHGSLSRLFRWMNARPMGHFPVWGRVRDRAAVIAHRERRALPELWILPEFSPNALVLRRGKRVHIALTEGLLRSVEAEELDAVLALCLAHGTAPRRGLQVSLALQLFPLARLLQSYSPPVQVFLSPWVAALMRLACPPAMVLRADRKAGEAFRVAAALQKMAVLARKIPLQRWNFALDPLFLLSPLALDGGPFWVFLSQPSVEDRRKALLEAPACERSAGLP